MMRASDCNLSWFLRHMPSHHPVRYLAKNRNPSDENVQFSQCEGSILLQILRISLIFRPEMHAKTNRHNQSTNPTFACRRRKEIRLQLQTNGGLEEPQNLRFRHSGGPFLRDHENGGISVFKTPGKTMTGNMSPTTILPASCLLAKTPRSTQRQEHPGRMSTKNSLSAKAMDASPTSLQVFQLQSLSQHVIFIIFFEVRLQSLFESGHKSAILDIYKRKVVEFLDLKSLKSIHGIHRSNHFRYGVRKVFGL